MKARLALVAALAGIGALAVILSQTGFHPIAAAHAECEPGTRIDKTTADQIRARLIKSGYKNPLHLRKGCDNTWHGIATKGDAQISVAVTADGHIVEEGD
ncbi:MAG TPA: hypothetical protein VG328_22215 [Stellaceae bacterium]|jgi:hypothetical protein|nr:hypothetical protein [Stellaceae bacterium]